MCEQMFYRTCVLIFSAELVFDFLSWLWLTLYSSTNRTLVRLSPRRKELSCSSLVGAQEEVEHVLPHVQHAVVCGLHVAERAPLGRVGLDDSSGVARGDGDVTHNIRLSGVGVSGGGHCRAFL